MDAVTYSNARANLKALIDGVTEDHVPVMIVRQRGKPVVLVSLEDWRSMQETSYLLSNPANAERLHHSIAQLDAGKGSERELIDP